MIVEFLFNDALLLDYFVTFYRTYVVVFSTFEVHIRFWKLIFIILMQVYINPYCFCLHWSSYIYLYVILYA